MENVMVNNAMTFNILIKKERAYYLAHCLELDIVATAVGFEEVRRDIIDLIDSAIDYAFSNDNLDHLYHPAPPGVWKEFFTCKALSEERFAIESRFQAVGAKRFVPPWMIAKICGNISHAHV